MTLDNGELGSAVVELAIVAPIFVALLFWTVYFTEFATLRIRQQEAGRFLAWEATTHSLSDFETGSHEHLFQAARADIQARAETRYGNLEGHNSSERPSTWIAVPVLARMDMEPIGLQDQETDTIGNEVLSEVEDIGGSSNGLIPTLSSLLRRLEGAIVPLLSSFGFQTRAVGVKTSASFRIENKLLPGKSLIFPPSLHSIPLAPATMHLETETWALPDGDEVGLRAEEWHPFRRQVNRIAHLGIGEKIRAQGKSLGVLLDLLPVSLTARVASQRYGDPSRDASRLGCEGGNALAATGKWKNGKKAGTVADGMSAVKCFDTLPMESNGLGSGYEGDPSFLQLRNRGEGYMGCSKTAAAGEDCDG